MFNRQPDVYNFSASVEPLSSSEQALQRLISGDIPQDELISSIVAVFSIKEAIDMVGDLQSSDAQAFIDVVNEV